MFVFIGRTIEHSTCWEQGRGIHSPSWFLILREIWRFFQERKIAFPIKKAQSRYKSFLWLLLPNTETPDLSTTPPQISEVCGNNMRCRVRQGYFLVLCRSWASGSGASAVRVSSILSVAAARLCSVLFHSSLRPD